jgi:hypothetical protein
MSEPTMERWREGMAALFRLDHLQPHDPTSDIAMQRMMALARVQGAWLYSNSLAGEFWMSPDDLVAEWSEGRFRWDPSNWNYATRPTVSQRWSFASARRSRSAMPSRNESAGGVPPPHRRPGPPARKRAFDRCNASR